VPIRHWCEQALHPFGVIFNGNDISKYSRLGRKCRIGAAVRKGDELRVSMTPEQIEEAERRVAEWQAEHPTNRRSTTTSDSRQMDRK
jgi:hypothetical protein